MSESARVSERNQPVPVSANAEAPARTMSPPAFQLQASEGETTQLQADPEQLNLTRGELTATGEGNDSQTSHIHWPNTAASGVTLGKGYDIGSRTAAEVIADLTAAGMSETQATQISRGAGLKGQAANTFVINNSASVGTIDRDVQYRLLGQQLEVYTENARNVATSTTATTDGKYYTNARGREVNDGVEAGTYVLSSDQWANLHPAMVEFLTDLKYQGGYYLYSRVAEINERLIQNDGDQLAQFQAVATLFEGENGATSYMDNYGQRIGEGVNTSGTFYGQSREELAGAITRRNRIRLGYLKQVISALESGQDVVFDTGQETEQAGGETTGGETTGGETTNENTGGETLSPPTVVPTVETPTTDSGSGGSSFLVGVKNGKSYGTRSQIIEVQEYLITLNLYSGTADGQLTLRSGGESNTIKGIKAFQKQNGLKDDGLVGSGTLPALKAAAAAKATGGGEHEEAEVDHAANLPMTKGVYVGVINGKAIGTRSQIIEVQTMLIATGHYSGTPDGHITLRSGGESNTIKAIKAFQRANSLTDDGHIGSGTYNALFAASHAAAEAETEHNHDDHDHDHDHAEETPTTETPTTEAPITETPTTESPTTETPVVAGNEGRNVTLTGSVGDGGTNETADVRKIQAALSRVGISVPQTGALDAATLAGINRFQRLIFSGWSDGVIDAGGNTLKRLNAMADNGTQGLETQVNISWGANARQDTVGAYPRQVLDAICQAAGISSIFITSTARTPTDQARAMYQNLVSQGVQAQYRLYGAGGDAVITEYVRSRNAGNNAAQIQLDMVAKINEVGPQRVSNHCVDPSIMCVVDVAPSLISNRPAFERAVRNESRVSKFLLPPADPAYHIEIPL